MRLRCVLLQDSQDVVETLKDVAIGSTRAIACVFLRWVEQQRLGVCGSIVVLCPELVQSWAGNCPHMVVLAGKSRSRVLSSAVPHWG